jgi:SAM-dependent methyltransferase
MHPWEQEYRNPQFITLGIEPIAAIRDFAKWLRRKQKVDMTDFVVLDLGCGNGKNLKYIIEQFAQSGIGYDISETAIAQARELAGDLPIRYEVRSIGDTFPLNDSSIDLVIDSTSSHALTLKERGKFLKEISRVLRPGGYLFIRTLAIEGDTNAKKLLKQFPGKESNTYVLPGTGMTERVASYEDLKKEFGKEFDFLYTEKVSGYQKWENQSYKRNYWIVYFQRK